MNIYISTFYKGLNFGSRLQATALSLYLEKKGHKAYIIGKFKAPFFLLRHPMIILARAFNFLMLPYKRRFFFKEEYIITEKRIGRLQQFEDSNLNVIDITNDNQWNRICSNKAVFVSGSDIIWNPMLGYPGKFFLDFAYYAKQTCMSYATSIGAKKLPSVYSKAYRKYLGHYVAISTREHAAAKLISDYVKRDVYSVVDPTMLISREDWDKFAQKAEIVDCDIECKYILCYFVMHDSRYWDYVKKFRVASGYKVIVLPTCKEDESLGYEFISDATPYEFIELIKKSEYVCTDSLHASIFSLLYEKEFYLIPRIRKAEDDKFNELLSKYGLEDRVVNDIDNFCLKDEIDYENVNRILAENIAFSKKYIDETLERYER